MLICLEKVLEEIIKEVNLPFVLIGGITLDNVKKLKQNRAGEEPKPGNVRFYINSMFSQSFLDCKIYLLSRSEKEGSEAYSSTRGFF